MFVSRVFAILFRISKSPQSSSKIDLSARVSKNSVRNVENTQTAFLFSSNQRVSSAQLALSLTCCGQCLPTAFPPSTQLLTAKMTSPSDYVSPRPVPQIFNNFNNLTTKKVCVLLALLCFSLNKFAFSRKSTALRQKYATFRRRLLTNLAVRSVGHSSAPYTRKRLKSSPTERIVLLNSAVCTMSLSNHPISNSVSSSRR